MITFALSLMLVSGVARLLQTLQKNDATGSAAAVVVVAIASGALWSLYA